MSDTGEAGVRRSHREFLRDFARRHTFTTRQLAELLPGRTLATRRKKASRLVVKAARKKTLKARGAVQLKDTGRPEIAYGRRCKPDEIEHEVMVAEVEVILRNRIERGVKVGRAEPDGVFDRDGRTCYLEVDHSGKMTLKKQIAAKWKLYAEAQTDGFILVIAMTETRMQKLREWSDLVQANALFTTFDRLRNGKPCVTWYGDTVSIWEGG